jgi:hypothetical protein
MLSIQMIQVGEQSGELEKCHKIADVFENEETTILRLDLLPGAGHDPGDGLRGWIHRVVDLPAHLEMNQLIR